ncbi:MULTISPECIES: hypothetical protein [Haloferax]|uniref:Uncharacterized protein n=2 Tax=Haloferax TaxID=2251 RepID=A0A6G1Z772_9EURY|nr:MULTISPECIES: hypothetical protein [Haloferax]KAB1184787.1 hypothetical protein Hfx1149_17130 [Haloferax sp. CBA1149]MRW82419.1 hypothetical protein [Haloferax marinisediminis]
MSSSKDITKPDIDPDSYSQKVRIINALAVEPSLHYMDLKPLLNCGKEYSRRIMKALSEGEISKYEVQSALDVDLQRYILNRIQEEHFHDDQNTALEKLSPSIKSDVEMLDLGFQKKDDPYPPRPSYGTNGKQVVVNTMEVAPELHPDEVAVVAGITPEYAAQIMRDVRNTKITPEQYEDYQNTRTQELILEYIEEAGLGQEEEKMRDVVNVSSEEFTDEEALEVIKSAPTKRARAVNAYVADLEDISTKDIGEQLIATSGEHVRRTFKQVEDGEFSDEELDEMVDDTVIAAIQTRYNKYVGQDENESEPEATAQEVANLERDAVPARVEEVESKTHEQATKPSTPATGEYVPVEELDRLIDIYEALKDFSENEPEPNMKATFMAEEVLNRLKSVRETKTVSFE